MTENDRDQALNTLIRQTIKDMGDVDPALLPHRLHERLKTQISGEAALEECIKDIIKEIESKNVRNKS